MKWPRPTSHTSDLDFCACCGLLLHLPDFPRQQTVLWQTQTSSFFHWRDALLMISVISSFLIILILQNNLSTITCNSKEPAGVAVCLLWKNLQIFSRQLRLQTKMTNMATPRRRLTALTATAMLEQTWPHKPWLLSSSLRGSKLHVRPKTRNSLA